MTKEYISREWLENRLRYFLSKSSGAEHYAYNVIKEDLDFVPSAEMIEVSDMPLPEYPEKI